MIHHQVNIRALALQLERSNAFLLAAVQLDLMSVMGFDCASISMLSVIQPLCMTPEVWELYCAVKVVGVGSSCDLCS